MKPTVLDSITRSGSLAGESVTMTVDVASMEHIMTLLTDLYSDRELAVIREYSTNALDSHVEAGNSKPIEVSTPGPLSPFFKVKDYGIGLDAEGIRNIYSKYGASTKRDTDKQVGMLGLGCKSALTYAPQFTLVGIKDGIKTVVAISRDERGRGNMEILEELVTNEPNGVEIMIPVTGRNQFNEKATKFFSFWKPGTVLVDGKQPVAPQLLPIKDNVYITDAEFGDYVVMGNVAYPVKSGAIGGTGWGREYSVVAFVEIGQVHFVPSREALHYTAMTEATLAGIKRIIIDNLCDAVQSEITDADTASVAYALFMKWNRILSRGSTRSKTMYWRGHELKTNFGSDSTYCYTIGLRNGDTKVQSITLHTLMTSTVISGFTEPEFLPKHKSKIRSWVNGKSNGASRMVVCDKIPGLPFTENVTPVSWSEIVNYKPVRSKSITSKKVVTTWPVVTEHGYVDDNTLIDPSKKLFYIERKRRQSFSRPNLGKDMQLVALTTNRVNNFIKMYPQAQELGSYLRNLAQAELDKLTPSDYAKMKIQGKDEEILKRLRPERIEDPEIQTMIDVSSGVDYSDAYKEFLRFNNQLEKFGFARVPLKADSGVSVFNVKDYPLLASLAWWQVSEIADKHIALYLNAVYNSKKGSN